ncbi:MAG: zinc-dependent metalloprotease [Bacteroidia bacterium]|nr:zinc-dependent metalloprotease [Bacteroidia bacterium]MCO5254622.1 zinc-dependent metalloprotease [Bacteroidota bacterium]
MKFRFMHVLALGFAIAINLLLSHDAQAQLFKKKKKPAAVAEAPASRPGYENFDKKVKGMQKIEGLFTFYRDTTTGAMYMSIDNNQIGQKFIYFSYSENGPASVGLIRGMYRGSKVFQIDRYYNQIEFNTQNNSFYFDTLSALSHARDANVVPGMMASEKIIAANTDFSKFLISADNIFLKETLEQIKSTPLPMGYSLGSLSPTKTKYVNVRSYPENSDIIVKYVYDDPFPKSVGGAGTTERRYTETVIQHSFIKVPQNNFKPRRDDQRVGYFTTQRNDMTTFEAVNYRDYIHRWNLEKKDPNAAVSEPVKPIVWWIENTTPIEYRETIKKAILEWNIAFEAAGFKNAVEVYVQPDTATWDAGDIRYNVMRWTSSPNPAFGGYGPSFVNPLTGEILGADIMFEFVFMTNRLSSDRLFKLTAMPTNNPSEYLEMLMDSLHHTHHDHDFGTTHCNLGEILQQQTLFGITALRAMGGTQVQIDRFSQEALYYLVLHEVGHTLGLTHNMRATQMLSPEELQNINITRIKGTAASVMDYPSMNFANVSGQEVQQYNTQPGPYDIWAITYGYSQGLNDEAAEEARLEKILARSIEKDLAYGNDADDMRSPGKGIDPRVNIFDQSNDAMLYAENRMKLVNKVFESVKQKYVSEGKSYHELRNAYMLLTGEYAKQGDVISRYVGGVYAERFMAGQKPGSKPLTPVALQDQKRAMKLLTDYVFVPNALPVPDSLLPFLQPQRRGFGFFSNTEDPKLLDRHLAMQAMPLEHLLAFTTLKRISDSRMYGNEYTLNDLFNDLNNAIFKADINGNVNLQRQNLQIYYIDLLDRNINSIYKMYYDNLSIARMTIALQDIKKMVQAGVNSGNEESKNHKKYLLYRIDRILDYNK